MVSVAQARGVLMCALAKNKIKVISYTPLQIKMTLTGYGRSEKIDIQKAVRKELKIKAIPRPNHAADALAAAITYTKKCP